MEINPTQSSKASDKEIIVRIYLEDHVCERIMTEECFFGWLLAMPPMDTALVMRLRDDVYSVCWNDCYFAGSA